MTNRTVWGLTSPDGELMQEEVMGLATKVEDIDYRLSKQEREEGWEWKEYKLTPVASTVEDIIDDVIGYFDIVGAEKIHPHHIATIADINR